MARNLTGEVTDEERFAWCLGKAHTKYGWTMELQTTGLLIKARHKPLACVHALSLNHTMENLAIYCPFMVVWAVWCRQGTQPFKQGPAAAEDMGLSPEQYRDILDATSERPGHDRSIRKMVLKACDLKDVPHKRRPLRKTL